MNPRTGAKTSYHHGDLRRAILEATTDLIDDKGLEAVSLRGVARQLDVSEAAPYHHFASKRDLLAALAAEAYRGFRQALESAIANETDPFERLKELGRAYIAYGLEKRGRYRLMFGSHMLDLASYEEVVEAGRPTRRILTDVVTECLGSASTDAETIENVSWALMHGITSLINEAEIRPEDPGATTDLIETGLSILVDGIGAYVRKPEPHRS